MKKSIIVLLCLALCLTVAACGNNDNDTSEVNERSEYLTYLRYDYVGADAIEIVDAYSKNTINFNNFFYFDTYVTIKNISDYPLIVDSFNTCSIYKPDGSLICDVIFTANSYPKFILPGEYAYMHSIRGVELLEFLDNETIFRCEPTIDKLYAFYHGQAAEYIFTYYDISNDSLQSCNAEGTRVQLTGTIDLTGSENADSITICSVGLDKNGTPICFFDEKLSPENSTFSTGEIAEFTIEKHLTGGLTIDDIAYYTPIEAYSINKLPFSD